MPIVWDKIIPRWGGDTIEPPEGKKDVGYIAGDKPPAKWENWLRKGTYEALDETRDVVENIDSQLAQMAFKGTLLKLPMNQLIANDSTVKILFSDIVYNEAGFYLGTAGDLVIPAGVSKVRATAKIVFAANATGRRWINIRKNGATFPGDGFAGFTPSSVNVSGMTITSAVFDVVAGDIITVTSVQSSGASLDVLLDSYIFLEVVK